MGFPILGSLAGLADVVKRTRANCVFITSSVLPDQQMEQLLRMAEELQLDVERWLPGMSAASVHQVWRRPVMSSAPLDSEPLIDFSFSKAGRDVRPV